MSEKGPQKAKAEGQTGGNQTGIFLVVGALLVVAVIAFFLISAKNDVSPAPETESAVAGFEAESPLDREPASGEGAEQEDAAAQKPDLPVIKPGNPVVAVVNGQDITRLDVFKFIQQLPQNMQQIPVDQLFPMALDQVVNAEIVEDLAGKAGLENDEDVREELEIAREQIIRNVFLSREIDSEITEEDLRQAYDEFVDGMEDVPEISARHILVEDEDTAKNLIAELDGGADFEALAKEHSTGPSASEGGLLGWFAKGEMVEEFSNAAFSLEPGQFSKEPVQTQFGWHVIKVEDERMRPNPGFDLMRARLEAQKRQEVLDNKITEWREQAEISKFDINGEPVESPSEE